MLDLPNAPTGTITALVTPFNRDGSLDLGALDNLVDTQLHAGIDGLVVAGTTGESPVLSQQEKDQLVQQVAKRLHGQIPLIVGTGSNDTYQTIVQQHRALEHGATCGLIVTPYYNKPTQEGLYRHYSTIADESNLPFLLYNVPGRTGCDISVEVCARLAQHPRCVGLKDATGDLERITLLHHSCVPHFALLSGDDVTACPFVLLGGSGVISVVSHLVPAEMKAMIEAARNGKVTKARELHEWLFPLIQAMFVQSNPLPVKAALAMQGRMGEYYRLPLCPMDEGHRRHLQEVLIAGGWLGG